MDHNDIRHKLSDFIDGSVTPNEKSAIEEHLKTCTACSDALAELRKTIEQVKQIEEVEAPAWMTQKIMANVRAETVKKKGFFRRLFYPLAVKLPIQAVGVLFLTITVYYIYSSMHPAEKYAEAPMGRFAKQEALDRPRDAHKQRAPEVIEHREKKVAQAPEYKSLDMKYEYEKPAEPAREEGPARGVASAPAPASEILKQQPTPAPAKRDALMSTKDEAGLEKHLAAPKAAAAPTPMAEQAAPSAGAAARNLEKQKATTLSTKQEAPFVTCFSYEPAVSTLNGVIEKIDFPGPPNFENIAKGDTRETFWILRLDRPVCVFEKDNDSINRAETGIVEIQLVLNARQFEVYKDVLLKRVVVRGPLFHSHTGHHHTPVLISVQSIELLPK